MDKLILTIDLDAFFTSCEELRYPRLKNIPIVVGHMLNGKGIVSTANYNARKFGIKSGIPIFKAINYYSNLKIIEPDYEYYQEKSLEVFNVINSFTNKIQISSIDECYVDATSLLNKYKPIQIAIIIKNKIKEITGLSASIGISTNIFLSKMASKYEKPNGITTMYIHELKNKLWKKPLIEMHMLGYSTEEKLKKLGIKKIGHLATLKNNPELYMITKNILGINLDKLIYLANGIDKTKIIVNPNVIKSINKEKTLEISTSNIKEIEKTALELLRIIINKLNNRKMIGKTLSLSLKNHKTFNKYSIRKTLNYRSNLIKDFSPVLLRLIDELYDGMSIIKQIAVSISNLKEESITYKQKTIDLNNFNFKVNPIIEIINSNIDINTQKELKISTGREYKENRKFNKEKTEFDRDDIKFKRWSN